MDREERGRRGRGGGRGEGRERERRKSVWRRKRRQHGEENGERSVGRKKEVKEEKGGLECVDEEKE